MRRLPSSQLLHCGHYVHHSLPAVVEFREKIEVRNPIGVDGDTRLDDAVSPLMIVEEAVSFNGSELGMRGVSSSKIALESEAGLPGALLVLVIVGTSFGRLVLGTNKVSLGARAPETPLRIPDKAEAGNSVATPGMPESERKIDMDNTKSGGIDVAILAVLLKLVLLGLARIVAVADGMAESAVPCRRDSIRRLSMAAGSSRCASSRDSAGWARACDLSTNVALCSAHGASQL